MFFLLETKFFYYEQQYRFNNKHEKGRTIWKIGTHKKKQFSVGWRLTFILHDIIFDVFITSNKTNSKSVDF